MRLSLCAARWTSVVGLVVAVGCSAAGGGAVRPNGRDAGAEGGSTNRPADNGSTMNPSTSPDGGGTTPPDDGLEYDCAGAEARSGCDGCTGLPGCGWCGASNTCMVGSDLGPDNGSCAGQWSWVQSDCSRRPCSEYTGMGCDICTDQRDCGWCAGTGTCMESQTGESPAACTSGWDWTGSMCSGG